MFAACCEKVRQILLHRPYEGCRYGLPVEVSVGFDVEEIALYSYVLSGVCYYAIECDAAYFYFLFTFRIQFKVCQQELSLQVVYIQVLEVCVDLP